MTYRTQIDDLLVPGFCISRGIVPVNIKVVPGIVHRLGKDCHRLTVRASNMVTSPDVSMSFIEIKTFLQLTLTNACNSCNLFYPFPFFSRFVYWRK